MPQAMQGIIIGVLISALVGIVIGFYLRQSQMSKLEAALKTSQEREKTLQQEHEDRLRTATAQLQQDYEAQLADKIERYQRQYETQRQQLEAEYEARQNLMPGGEPPNPKADPSETWDTAPASEYEARLRQQYEARLKEAAYKIQQAYEQHLRETLATEREAQQQEYDQRLAEAIAHYQDEADARLADALKEQELAVQTGGLGAGGTVDETQVQERLAILEAELRSDYDRRLAERIEQYQDEMSQRLAQLEQEFTARLQMAQATQPTDDPPSLGLPANADLEARYQAEYDQRLAEVVARHQDDMTERIQALTADYEARLQMAQGGAEMGAADTTGIENDLRHRIEAELRAEYDLRLAERLEQVQADLNQRTQDFEAGLIATMDPFVDTAVQAEALEDDGLAVDPFPDLDASPPTTWADDPEIPAASPGVTPMDAVNLNDTGIDDAGMEDASFGTADQDAFGFEDADLDSAVDDDSLSDLGFDGADSMGTSSEEDTGLGESDLAALGFDAIGDLDLGNSGFEDANLGDAGMVNPDATLNPDEAGSELDSAFNLDDLDLSVLSDEDLALADGDEEDIFNLETLAQRAGVDLGELNNLLNQPNRPTTAEEDPTDLEDEDWGNLS